MVMFLMECIVTTSEMEVAYTAFCFTFNSPYFYASQGAGWANGYNVRCVKVY